MSNRPAKRLKLEPTLELELVEEPNEPIAHPDVIIDKSGDLLLIVGSKTETSILVSAKILATASDVFKASFEASRRLIGASADISSDQPLQLALPDDNAASMTILCNILHFQNRNLPKPAEVTLTMLKDFALACDKYRCADAVRFVSNARLEPRAEEAAEEGKEDYLTIAYLLDDFEAFQESTKQLVLNWGGDFDELKEKIDVEQKLPPLIFDELNEQHSLLTDRLEKTLEEHISAFLDKEQVLPTEFPDDAKLRRFGRVNTSRTRFCMLDSFQISAYLRELRRLDLWPIKLSQRKVAEILDNLRTMSVENLVEDFGFPGPVGGENYQAYELPTKAMIESVIHLTEEGAKGLCLYCVRAETSSSEGCGMDH